MPDNIRVAKAQKIQKIAKELLKELPDALFQEKIDEGVIKKMTRLANSPRPCLPGQVAPVLAITKGLMEYNFAVLLAEMGTGKTQMSMATFSEVFAEMSNQKGSTRKGLFLTVGKLMGKMTREAYEVFGEDKIEVFEIVNQSRYETNSDGSVKVFAKDTNKRNRYGKMTAYKKGDLIPTKLESNQVFADEVLDMVVPEGKLYIYMVSKDSAKLGLGTDCVMEWGDRCTECNSFILPKNFIQKNNVDSIKWKLQELPTRGKPLNCPNCGNSCEVLVAPNLATAKNPIFANRVYINQTKERKQSYRKTTIGQQLRRQLNKRPEKKIFDLVVVDEVHEMQSPFSNQGKLYRDLVNVSKKALIMTGTLSNGYPSSIFYILQGIMPNYLRKEGFKFYDVNKFVDQYGALKYTRTADVVEKKGSRTQVKVNELPKISEAIVGLLAPFTYWLKMEDLNLPMPSYREDPYVVEMDLEVKQNLDEFKNEVVAAISKYDPKRLKSFAQRFVYLQNNPTFPFTYEFKSRVIQFNEELGEEEIVEKDFNFEYKPVAEDKVYAKEQRLINYIKSELVQGRNVMVYSIYNKSAEISKRLGKVIEQEIPDITIKVMPESVSGDKIEPWIMKNPCDVLICSPLKVSTGLDLVQFPTIAFYETGTNLRIVQQASRRSWRAFGQDFPVKVAFFAYQGLQAKLLDLLGKKLKGAAIVEGRVVEAGQLANEFDDDADFTEALNNIAKEIEEDIKPDFSSSIIEEGRLRPNTKFEQAYIDILEEVKHTNFDDLEESVFHHHEHDEVEKINLTEIDSEDDISDEDIASMEVDENEINEEELSENVACKCKSGQLSFDF